MCQIPPPLTAPLRGNERTRAGEPRDVRQIREVPCWTAPRFPTCHSRVDTAWRAGSMQMILVSGTANVPALPEGPLILPQCVTVAVSPRGPLGRHHPSAPRGDLDMLPMSADYTTGWLAGWLSHGATPVADGFVLFCSKAIVTGVGYSFTNDYSFGQLHCTKLHKRTCLCLLSSRRTLREKIWSPLFP